MKKLLYILVIALVLCSSCEKEKHYPVIEKITVTYLYDKDFNGDVTVVGNEIVGYNPTDTISVVYELDTTYQYVGDDPESFVRSKSPGVIKITMTCGDYVNDVHYESLTKHVEHYVKYILW